MPDTYDYIIVGAGSAGCVLANRLSADAQVSVCLLEAGGQDDAREVRIPAAFAKLFKGPADWDYHTLPQPHMKDRAMYWPRGKLLGGCSSINAMIYIRGHRRDYDRWRDLGNTGWGYDDVLPFFLRGEGQHPGVSEYHRADGELRVDDSRHVHAVSRAFVAACTQAGHRHIPDFNVPEPEGCGFYQVTQHRGARHSAADAFLRPALSRPNLHVETEAQVHRVILEGNRATGIQLDNRPFHARREVILCAGAIGSPQILLLSGIGPGAQLQELGIGVQHDLPGVGENLQDHLLGSVMFTSLRKDTLDSEETLPNLLRYLLLRRGPLTSNIAEAGGFFRTQPDLEVPDLQIHFAPGYYVNHGFERPEGNGFAIGPTLLHPESRGCIRLSTPDPRDKPAIDANYFDAQADVDTLVRGTRLCREIAAQAALDPWRGKEYFPGADRQSDEAIADFLRERAETLYHPVGTCKMGTDPMAVVDPALCVHGIEGLRVADASIMPEIVGGNTNAPAIMIGEKAADLIRALS